MTEHKVINGSVQLDPVKPMEFQVVKLLVDKVISGSVRSRDEIVLAPPALAEQWIAAQEAESVSAETPAAAVEEETPAVEEEPAEPRPRRKKAE